MVTFTSRARLIKPAETGEVVDVSQVNANMDKIDANLGVYYCTSTTRPTDPFPGQVIRESDTGLTLVRNGGNTAWEQSTGIGYYNNFAPPVSDVNMSGTDGVYTVLAQFYLPASTPPLMLFGSYAVAAQPSTSADNLIDMTVWLSENSSTAASQAIEGVSVNRKTFHTDTTGIYYEMLNFNYLLAPNNSNRYLRYGVKRNTVPTTIRDGSGQSHSLVAFPVGPGYSLTNAIPGSNVMKG